MINFRENQYIYEGPHIKYCMHCALKSKLTQVPHFSFSVPHFIPTLYTPSLLLLPKNPTPNYTAKRVLLPLSNTSSKASRQELGQSYFDGKYDGLSGVLLECFVVNVEYFYSKVMWPLYKFNNVHHLTICA